MAKIKVLWVITGGLRRNGICVSQLEYAKRLNKEKFSLSVLAVHNNSENMIEEYRKANCNVIILPDRRKNFLQYIKQLIKLLKEEKFDVVHSFGSSSLMGIELGLAKLFHVPMRIAHSRNTTCDRKILEILLRPIFKCTYNFALSCGVDAGNWLFGCANFTILHNGKNLTTYSYNNEIRAKIRKKYNLDDKIVYGHVGNFNYQKNHNFLIEIFSEIYKNNPKSILLLMGNGELMDDIMQQVEKNGILKNVLFLGSISNVSEILQAADIMLFPSRFEGLPNVVIEWQAAGLPCVLSNKITTECAVCDLVKFLPIDEGVEPWLNNIKSIKIFSNDEREKNSKYACEMLKENSFEIEENVLKLEKIYKQKGEN